MPVSVVYMTVASVDEAETIGKALVRKRLAACVNIIDGMRSFYEWDGAIQDDREVVMIAKTRTRRVPEMIDAVKALHSYDCPCIIEMEVSGGNRAFLDWIGKQVDSPSPEDG
jgi:periplasmic divalent cation tolerance protein